MKQAILDAAAIHGRSKDQTFVSFRVTQLYETGAAVYVYFAIPYHDLPMDKVVDIYEDIEHRSREVVMQYGGSISHHHGVGKLRKRFMEKSVSEVNMQMNNGIKNSLDPKNIFASSNTFYKSAEERKEDLEHTV